MQLKLEVKLALNGKKRRIYSEEILRIDLLWKYWVISTDTNLLVMRKKYMLVRGKYIIKGSTYKSLVVHEEHFLM